MHVSRCFLVFSLVTVLLMSATVQAENPSQPDGSAGAVLRQVDWHRDLQAAHKEAIRHDRPLLIVFGAEWCGYCTKLERQVLTRPELVRTIHVEFIPVQLDFDSERRIADILAVRSLPCTVVLSPEADLLGRIVGYAEPQQYQQALRRALALQSHIRQAARATAEAP